MNRMVLIFLISFILNIFASSANAKDWVCTYGELNSELYLQAELSEAELFLVIHESGMILEREEFIFDYSDDSFLFPMQAVTIEGEGESEVVQTFVKVKFIDGNVQLYWVVDGDVFSDNLILECMH